jgi:hypothetical protein
MIADLVGKSSATRTRSAGRRVAGARRVAGGAGGRRADPAGPSSDVGEGLSGDAGRGSSGDIDQEARAELRKTLERLRAAPVPSGLEPALVFRA